MKLSDAFQVYLEESGTLNTEQSVEGYQRTVNQLIRYAGDKALGSYTVEELTAFCLGDGGRGTAPRTIGARRDRLHSIFSWCAHRKIVARDVTVELAYTVKAKGGGVVPHTWLTKAETVAINQRFNLEDPRGHRDFVIYRTTLMLGLRCSEVASLRWPMFRDDLSTVTVLRKGRKLRTKPVPPALRTVLHRWRELEPADAVPFPRFRWLHFDEGRRMAPQWGTALTDYGIYRVIRDVVGVATHDLRRSFAGILEADDVKLKDIQGLMDHENVGTTDRYLTNSPQRLARVTDAIDWG